MTARFKTEEVSSLWKKYQGLSHPESPFLDKSHWPSSLVPCRDFTLDIAQLILDGKLEAVWELLEFLGAEKKFFLPARIPEELSIDSFGMAEIIAAFLLTWRMPCSSCQSVSMGTEVFTSILASHCISLTAEGYSCLKALTVDQLQMQRQAELDLPLLPEEDDVVNERCIISENVNKDFSGFFALNNSDGDIVTACMSDAPPMVRIALARFFLSNSDYWRSKVRFDGGNSYGCSAEIGFQCIKAMPFLDSALPRGGQLPREITKENLYDGLRENGLAPAKSLSRPKLVELAFADEALLKRLLRKYAPGLVCVKPEFKDEAEKWFRRYSLAQSLARGVFADMISKAFAKEFHVPLAEVERERTGTVMDTAKCLFRGKSRHDGSMTCGARLAFPGLRLVRLEERDKPRNWMARWNTARQSLGAASSATVAVSPEGPFVALKGDPIWSAISRFGNPYPPFDFGSGMGVEDVGYDEAAKLGLTP